MADSPIPDRLPLGIQPASLPMGKYELRFECIEMGDEFRETASRELREIPDVVKDAMDEFRDLLKAEKGLNVPLDEDWFLLQFLRPCKFYPQSALERVRNFFQFEREHPKLCAGLVPSKNKNIFLQGILTILPTRDQYGRRMLLLECGRKWKPSLCTTDEIMRGVMLLLKGAMLEPRTQISGAVILWDFDGLSMEHALHLSASFAKMLLHWVQDCIPIRLKALHIINQSLVFKMVFSIFKPFIGSKLRNRLYFHGRDRESLMKHVDSKYLPTKYGGTMELEELPGEDVYNFFCNFEEQFEEYETFGYNKVERTK
ncbi:alpha-tocopherol transfer protein-like isoform X2 [Anabrus simplex]|uniref:alpha-tocopherol transfer protein-like isoform X2 n=1 Tax=Anabrus simplex TaxID=316456 RepID=UPI0034DD63F7